MIPTENRGTESPLKKAPYNKQSSSPRYAGKPTITSVILFVSILQFTVHQVILTCKICPSVLFGNFINWFFYEYFSPILLDCAGMLPAYTFICNSILNYSNMQMTNFYINVVNSCWLVRESSRMESFTADWLHTFASIYWLFGLWPLNSFSNWLVCHVQHLTTDLLVALSCHFQQCCLVNWLICHVQHLLVDFLVDLINDFSVTPKKKKATTGVNSRLESGSDGLIQSRNDHKNRLLIRIHRQWRHQSLPRCQHCRESVVCFPEHLLPAHG